MPTAAHQEVEHDNTTVYNYSELQTLELERSVRTVLAISVLLPHLHSRNLSPRFPLHCTHCLELTEL